MSDRKKLLKVELTFEDKKYTAEGKDAESWQVATNSYVVLAVAHGHPAWNSWTKIEEVHHV